MLPNLNRLFKLFHLHSNTYQQIQKDYASVWKNQRYYLISEYWALHVPPFNIITRCIACIFLFYEMKNSNGIFINSLIYSKNFFLS
jgi:hypothetical protein